MSVIYTMARAKVPWFIKWKSAIPCCRFHLGYMNRAGKKKWHEAEVNETKNTWFCRTTSSHWKRNTWATLKRKWWFPQAYEFVEVMSCRKLFAKPGAFPKSCYRQQSWGKGTAWQAPHRRSQGNDVRSRFSSSSLLLLLPALMRKVTKMHRNTWKGLKGGPGRQWTECRHSVLLHVWFNEITCPLSLLIHSDSSFALIHWQLLPSV